MMLETMRGQPDLPRWSETIFSILSHLKRGTLSFSLPDGRAFVIRGTEPGPEGHFDIIDERLFARVIRDGDLGFCESYMDGWWDSPDLQALLRVHTRMREAWAVVTRHIIIAVLFFLPEDRRIAIERRLRGKEEFRKLQLADWVLISTHRW